MQGHNPLYKGATSTFTNITYRGKDWPLRAEEELDGVHKCIRVKSVSLKLPFFLTQIEHEKERIVHILLLYICKVKNGTSVFLFVTGWMIIFCILHDYICQHSDLRDSHWSDTWQNISFLSLMIWDMNDKKPEWSFQLLMACGNTESLIVNMKYPKYKLFSLLWL